jgi:uncharacterized ion transporter superfamily protein YfcC
MFKKLASFLGSRVNPFEATESNTRWRYRRKLIIGGFSLGVIMILFGMATFWWDRNVSSEAIIGGVAIVVALLGAYTGFATYDDVKISQETHFRRGQEKDKEENLDNELPNESWDG